MKRIITGLLGSILAVALLAGCTEHQTSQEAPFKQLSLARSSCFGACLVYQVDVDEAGMAVFHGQQFVAVKGEAQRQLTAQQQQVLAQAVQQSDFASWQERYRTRADGCTSVATDMPSITLHYQDQNIAKTVHYYEGCMGLPAASEIKALAHKIDTLIGTATWIKPDS